MNRPNSPYLFAFRACLAAAALLAALVLATPAPATEVADDAPQPQQSAMPRVDRDLLLGFLADNSTLTLIDARSPAEFSTQHLPGAVNIPFDAVEAHGADLPTDRDKPIVVYCRTGKRAGLLKAELTERGYRDVRILPREQIFWEDTFMVFNCGTESAATEPGPASDASSTRAATAPE